MFHILNLSLFGCKFHPAFLTAKFLFIDVKKRELRGDESTTKVVLKSKLIFTDTYFLQYLLSSSSKQNTCYKDFVHSEVTKCGVNIEN